MKYLFIILMIIISGNMYSRTNITNTQVLRTVKSGPMTFQYAVSGTVMTVRLSAAAKGWLAVGFMPDNRMAGADIYLAVVDKDKVTVEDHYGTGRVTHSAVTNVPSVISDITGGEDDSGSWVSFKVNMAPNDGVHKDIKFDKPIKVILACSQSDNPQSRHSYRSTVTIEP